MAIFEHAIDVNAPVNTVYNQWTQFEEFPHFMEGIESVTQLDDKTLLWKAEIAGNDQEWRATITEQTPDQRIAWTSIDGARNGGAVTFHYLDDNTTRVMLQLEYDPEGFIETVGSAIGVVDMRVQRDLENFKEFIEGRREATGAWRGVIPQS